MRSYLATAGGFDVKKTFTSTATSVRESLGGSIKTANLFKDQILFPVNVKILSLHTNVPKYPTE